MVAQQNVNVKIDGKEVSASATSTILQAAREAGVYIPTLCYFEGLNEIGACRVCVVEVQGEERLQAACNTPVREGMIVHTNTPRVQAARKTNLELICSMHTFDCVNCNRADDTCILRKLVQMFDIDVKTPGYFDMVRHGKRSAWSSAAVIQRTAQKCVQCGRCVSACSKLQGLDVWEFEGTGSHARIGVVGKKKMPAAGCVACGQCITHCPTAALTERDDTAEFMRALRDPNITTVVQIAPATRTAWSSVFGGSAGDLSVERMCACLKAMGADYVFDTSFAADLTIMEEGTELLEIVKSGNAEKLPLFTSCCPGWVQHAINKHPRQAAHLSSAKSPMQMFGSVVKTWWAQKNNIAPENIYSVALMPCTAKKKEIGWPQMSSNACVPDMNASLTTREFARMVKHAGINPFALEDVPLDNPLGTATGAGVIFGRTGGVMEAALRTAAYLLTGDLPDPDAFVFKSAGAGDAGVSAEEGSGVEDGVCVEEEASDTAGMQGSTAPAKPWSEAEFNLAGKTLRCAVVHGLANTDKLLAALEAGVAHYDFIEVMACPGGCAGGGGQPIDGSDTEPASSRAQVLTNLDKNTFKLRFSHENPVVKTIYEDYFTEPCSPRAEQLLHVHTRQSSAIE